MAETTETTVLKVVVNGKELAIDSIKTAKQAVKDLNSEILKTGDPKAIKALAEVKDKLEDIQEATATAKGSGIEKLTASFKLFGQGLVTLDTDKLKTGFKGLGAAMSALPIFLLVQGIQLLVENFDVVIDVARNFLGVTKDNEIAAARLVAQIDAEAQAIQNLSQIQDDATKTEVLRAKLRGDSEVQVTQIIVHGNQQKIRSLEEYVKFSTDAYNRLLRNNSASVEDVKKAGDALQKATQDLSKARTAATNFNLQSEIDFNKKIQDAIKDQTTKEKEEFQKREAQRKEHDAKINQNFASSLAEEQQLIDADAKLTDQKQKDRDAQKIAGIKLVADEDKALRDQAVSEAQANAAKQKELDKRVASEKLQIQNSSFQAAKGLSDLFFQIQENGAQGNAKKLNEIAKKKFAVDKAFNIAQATIDGIRSVQAALTIPPPFGQVLAVANGVLAAANVARIAATQFTGTPSTPSTDFGGGVAAPAPPPPQQLGQATTPVFQSTNLTQPQTTKVAVLEGDIRDATTTITKVVQQAKFP